MTRSIARFLRKYQAFRRQLLCGTISCEIADINLTGSFTVAREAGKLMRAHGGGAIVNIASISGQRGQSRPVGLWRVQGRRDHADPDDGVRAGAAEHPGQRHRARSGRGAAGPGDADRPDAARNGSASLPQRRYASPDEIAGAALFLMDDSKASFVTGHILNVEGGFAAVGYLPVRT